MIMCVYVYLCVYVCIHVCEPDATEPDPVKPIELNQIQLTLLPSHIPFKGPNFQNNRSESTNLFILGTSRKLTICKIQVKSKTLQIVHLEEVEQITEIRGICRQYNS